MAVDSQKLPALLELRIDELLLGEESADYSAVERARLSHAIEAELGLLLAPALSSGALRPAALRQIGAIQVPDGARAARSPEQLGGTIARSVAQVILGRSEGPKR